jgi:hypothetical protein
LIAPGFASMRPTVATRSGSLLCRPFHHQNAFCGGGERIAAQRHRHGPGVPGFAAQRDAKPGEPVDRGDHAHGQALGFEHRALLDVQFGVGKNIAFLPSHPGKMLRI